MSTPISRVGTAMWHLQAFDSVTSTNDLARDLPAWSAVRAQCQTAGRGRFGRTFVSDDGGLWLSAVLPAVGGPARWGGFSLMVGNHIRILLGGFNIPDARLRWPNDLMVRNQKLGGLLIEQGRNETLTVGLGLNVKNTPWTMAPDLASTTTRLVDILPDGPDVSDLTVPVLDALADAHEAMLRGGLALAIREFNAHHRPVQVNIVQPDGKPSEGEFIGLDTAGNLRLIDASGDSVTVPHTQVERLTEKTTSPFSS
jgi:BirA family transcriptional regulator, biotin operon repressor / biotin---[acetyl-CoA-carboxylase] ligase